MKTKLKEAAEVKFTERIQYFKDGDLFVGKLTNYSLVSQANSLKQLQIRLKIMLQSYINLTEELLRYDSFETVEIKREDFNPLLKQSEQSNQAIQELVQALNKGIEDVEKRQEICLDKHRYEKLESLKEGLYFALGLIQKHTPKQ